MDLPDWDFNLIGTVIAFILSIIGLSWFAGSDAPYVATKQKKIAKILKEVGISKETVFYELGSGDGRVVLEAARLGANANGVEQSWLRVWFSRYKAWRLKLPNTHFYHGNIFNLHYYPADVVYVFLLPKAVEKLELKLKQELQPGSLVITQAFHFPHWKPFKKIDLTEKDDQPLSGDGSKKPGDFWIYKR
jgi:SAM-dependent methyltransferase